jgi:NADP-dependent 3-hydroxy acid dehydrogenase YdfG
MSAEVVVVTGASSGIGRACAERFAAESAQVVACARRGDRIAALERDYPGRVRAEVLDVRDREAAENLAGRIHRDYGRIDILVNAAGLGIGRDSIPDSDPGEWDFIVATTVQGLLNLTKPVALKWCGGAGHVINIGSIAGHEIHQRCRLLCQQAAVDRITGLRMDILGTGVRVSTIDPGLVETEFALVRFRGDERRADRWYEGSVALTAADVADAVWWVATRPAHVQVAELLIYPTDQAAIRHLARREM